MTRKLAFIIALFYVGIGTLSVCSAYPSDQFYGKWSLYGTFFTLPVSFLSMAFRFANSKVLYPVFIIQTITFVFTFLILLKFIKKK